MTRKRRDRLRARPTRIQPSSLSTTGMVVCAIEDHAAADASGATVARFAGDTVHQRLRNTEPYKRKEFEASLKRAFLSTDEDLRTSASPTDILRR